MADAKFKMLVSVTLWYPRPPGPMGDDPLSNLQGKFGPRVEELTLNLASS